MLDGAAVVAEPGGIVVADADGEDQPVIVQRPLRGDHPAPLAVDVGNLGLDEGVVVSLGGGWWGGWAWGVAVWCVGRGNTNKNKLVS